jgi:peptidoglycan/xylan/chitin deacetylase (PgdA/CDA1 family)
VRTYLRVTLYTCQQVKGWYQLMRVFIILGMIFLLGSFLWYFCVKRKLLQQEIAALQARNRFLYTGNICLPRVALTFDDGPNPHYTPQVLAVLKQYGVKATFFCVGQHVAAYPDLVKQEYAAGHAIGNHSWSHPVLAFLSGPATLSQLKRTSDAIQQVIGVRPIFFRPPYGAFSSQVLTRANCLGMITVIWNVRATDWAKPGVDVISDRVIERTGNGAIILLHDGGGDRSETVAALPTIIEGLQRRGFTFVTLQEMMDDLGSVSKKVGGPEDQAWWDLLMQFFPKFRRRT